MSEFAEAKPHPIMGHYAALETKVLGIEKTVDNLGRFVRDENIALRREMADQNAGLKHEMSAQNATVIAAIDKLTQTASASNDGLRAQFGNEIKAVSDKQGMRANTLIALCTFGLMVMGYVFTMNNRPTDAAIADLKASLNDLKTSTAKNEADFVPKPQIDGIDDRVKKIEENIVGRREQEAEQILRNKIYELTEKVRDVSSADAEREREESRKRNIERFDEIDGRLRAVEQKTAK